VGRETFGAPQALVRRGGVEGALNPPPVWVDPCARLHGLAPSPPVLTPPHPTLQPRGPWDVLGRRGCRVLTSTSVRKWTASGSVTRRFLFSTSFLSLEHLWDTETPVRGQTQGHVLQGHSETPCHHTAALRRQSGPGCGLSPTCTGSRG